MAHRANGQPRVVLRRWLLAGCAGVCAWSSSVEAGPLPRETAAEEAYAELPEYESRSCRQVDRPGEPMMDRAHTRLEETVCGAALWFDGLFGDERNVDAARGAYGRLETSLENSEFYGTKHRTRFKLRVDLPNLQERLSIFVGRDNEESIERDRSEGFALRSEFPQLDDRDQFFAGIGYGLPRRERFNTDVRVGVRSVSSPRAFVQTRMEYLPYADHNETLQMRLTPFYSTRDGFGVTPGVDYSLVLSPRLLVRWSNVATISESTDGMDWRSAAILYRGLGWGRGLAYETFVRGLTGTEVPLREYGVRLIYRHAVFRNRLYLQPLIGFSWPKDEPAQRREGTFLAGMGVELPFGQKH